MPVWILFIAFLALGPNGPKQVDSRSIPFPTHEACYRAIQEQILPALIEDAKTETTGKDFVMLGCIPGETRSNPLTQPEWRF